MKPVLLFLCFLGLLTSCSTPPSQVGTQTYPPTPIQATQTLAPSPTPEPFTRDTFFLESAELQTLPDQSGLVLLHIQGQLPTSCHQFGSAICPTCAKNAPNQIQVNVYSIIETGRSCEGPTVPIEQNIPLGVFTEGIYVVQVNGQYIGEFDAATFGNEVQMVRGIVVLETINIIAPQTATSQPKVVVQGFLPTPCNVFKADVSAPNDQGEIQIDAYSLAPAGEACIDVIQDFTSEIPLGQLLTGTYSIWINGEEKGELVVP